MSVDAAILSVELAGNPAPLVDAMVKASQATGAYAEAAEKNMVRAQSSFGGLNFSVVTSKARAETLKLVELQHQLDVARAAGEKGTVAGLEQEIQLLQRVRQLRSAGLSQGDAQGAARASLNAINAAREAAEAREQAAQRREKLTGNPGQALAGAFARVRVGSFEEAGAKVPIFGAQLEELGAAGLVAAAGIAAAALAAEQVKQAMEFSEQLDRDAKSLGVTTTQLQQFDYATAGTSVGIDKGREALAQFNTVFGRYSAGLAQGRTASTLNALGFTPESARQIGSTTEALEKALSALAKLQNPQQRAALADRLGLKDFLPVIAEGQEGIERFIATMAKAQGAGAVISPEEVQRAAELNDKLQQVEHTIDVEVKKAFVELAPFVLQVAQLIERAARAAATLAGNIPHFVSGLGPSNGPGSTDRNVGSALGSGLRDAAAKSPIGQAVQLGQALAHNILQRGRAIDLRKSAQSALGGHFDFSPFDDAQEALKGDGKGVDLSAPKKAKAAPEDPTPGLNKAATDTYQSALKDLSTALAALTGDVQAHADLEKQAIDEDTTKKVADIDAQILKAKNDRKNTNAAIQVQELQQARLAEQNTASAKKEKIDRDAEQALREKALQRQQEADALTARGRTAAADRSGGAYGKARATLDNLRDQQLDEVLALQAKQAPQIKDGSLSQADADANVARLRSVQRDEYLGRRQDEQRQINPLYARANPTTSVGDELQGIEGRGLDQLSDGLAAALTGTKTLKAAFHDMVQSIVADLAKLLIQREVEGPLANLLFGAQGNNLGTTTGLGSVSLGAISGSAATDFSGLTSLLSGGSNFFGAASGTDSSAGGEFEVGEEGPEDIRLPKGSQVIPNTQIGMPSRGMAQVSQTFSFDLTGAVVTDDLLAQMNAIGSQAAVAGAQGGRDLAIQRLSRRQRYSR